MWTSIPHAHEYWRCSRTLAEPPSDLDEAERFILTAAPANVQDAACIVDVICAYRGDPRCDDLDRDALERVRTLLFANA